MDILDARFIAAATTLGQLPAPARAEIAFAGRSNVGKSSLINSLVQRKKLVRTSSTPGCTRGINIFRVVLRDELEVDMVDLPGYGYAQRSKKERRAWGPLIEGFLAERPSLRAVVVIVDVRRGLEEDDAQLVEYLKHLGRRVIVVATKVDKLPASKRKPRLAEIRAQAGVRVLGFSATTAEGRPDLWQALVAATGTRG